MQQGEDTPGVLQVVRYMRKYPYLDLQQQIYNFIMFFIAPYVSASPRLQNLNFQGQCENREEKDRSTRVCEKYH